MSVSTRPPRSRPGGPRPFAATARAAAARGWPVFPLHPFSKVPGVKDWERWATTDLDRLDGWCVSLPRRAWCNVGIACGPAGLVVADLDAAHGHRPPPAWAERGARDGAEVFAVLAAGAGAAVPATYTVATPSGGRHLYFAAPAGAQLRNTASAVGWRVDTRAAGGYVVAAGSVLRIRGRVACYRVTDTSPVAELPAWLLAALRPAVPAAPAVGVTGESHSHPGWRLDCGRLDAYVGAAVRGEAARVAAAGVGTRNQTLFRAAANLGGLVGAGLLDPGQVTAALLVAARHHVGVAGFTEHEARRAIGNGLAAGRRHPREVPDSVP